MHKYIVGLFLGILLLASGFGGFGFMVREVQGGFGGEAPYDLPPRDTPVIPPTPSDTPAASPTPLIPSDRAIRAPSRAEPARPRLGALNLEISLDKAEARVGDRVRFVIQLANHGKTSASNLEVLGLMPSKLTILDASSTQGSLSIQAADHQVKVFLGSLKPGEAVVITIVTQVSELAIPGGKNYAAARVRQGAGEDFEQLFSSWVSVYVVKD